MKTQDIKELDVKKITNEIIDTISSHYEKEIEEQIAANKEMDKMIGEKDKEIEELKRQLADKDEQIEYLRERNIYKVYLKNEECLGVYPKNMEKIIRHQVCEEIRKKAKDIAYYECDWLVLSLERLEEEILDQIEKGE